MRTITRRVLLTTLATLAIAQATAYAVPFEELSRGRRMRYTAEAVAANVVPGVSGLAEPKCLQGYILCKFTFAAFSVVAAGESLIMSGGRDMEGSRAVLYRGFAGDWWLTPRDVAGETKAELLPEPPPSTEKKPSGGFVPPPL